MDGFTYHDIFQTKGIEYLIIIAFLLLLIPFWLIINRKEEIIQKIKKTLGILTTEILKIPKGVLFSNNHTWTFLEKSGIAEIGIDDWLLHVSGEVGFVNLKATGDEINKGELLLTINSKGRKLRILSPLSGKITETNPIVENGSPALEKEPYTKGWIYKLEPLNWKEETANYYCGEEASRWLKTEIDRLKDFISVSISRKNPEASMVIMQEGGELRDHPLFELSGEVWQDFQKIFLDN